MEIECRPFSAGSRQAPDPYDQFLEQEGFYRKHTARDSTCLFRVVSEQIFDVQLYHEKVRNDCVHFMRKRREFYEKQIHGDFEDYLDEMSKYHSHGTFLELDALAHVYQRNVLLFGPYNCGTWFVKCDSYKDSLMVFFSPDKHFDSIFPTTYIEQAAYCQGVVYEILYINVFKLPDVMYSVERMLHDPAGKTMRILERQEKPGELIETSDGRQFIVSTAAETECVLDNYRLCHFHNKDNFAAISDIYCNKKRDKESKEVRSVKTHHGKGPLVRELTLVNPMLSDKKISCVRQLLQEGITPFPYKVAKALDPSIYRNIEFDSWSDTRRELKYRNWYFGGNSLQISPCLPAYAPGHTYPISIPYYATDTTDIEEQVTSPNTCCLPISFMIHPYGASVITPAEYNINETVDSYGEIYHVGLSTAPVNIFQQYSECSY
ncbi:protein ovarian tumor locus-like isoform X2 [Topomyia yanbarensis]|uniref:protein ovarian tumor locus-like isoform X2 n=1 Tax=Topomyia yanbarensis TaxID=2498891 RepID=UPI00273C8114|nr:protein ovarian tumor locus-like isoform X2 [Topomyia yanbarensis]